MRQIFVDSRDRVPGGTSTNFSITLPQTLALESGHQGRIDDLRLPVNIPTIYLGHSSIKVRMLSTDYEVFIAEGQYNSGSDLANEIRNALTPINGAWTVTYDTRKTSMEISCTNAFTFTGGTYMTRLLERPYVYTGSKYTFPYAPLQGLDIAYLCCSNFAHLDTVGPKGASDCLCQIPIQVGYGAVQTYSMSSSVFFDIPALTTQQLSFQLRDRDYNVLSIVPNISFVLTID